MNKREKSHVMVSIHVHVWIVDMFVETFSWRLWDPRYPLSHPWPVQTHLFPPPSPPTPKEGSGTIVDDGGAAKGAAESNMPVQFSVLLAREPWQGVSFLC